MKKAIIVVSLGVFFTLIGGCGNLEHPPVADKSLAQIREEAGNIKNNHKNLDLENTRIIIPENDRIDHVIFPIQPYDFYEKLDELKENIVRYKKLDDDTVLDNSQFSISYWDTNEEGEEDEFVVKVSEAEPDQIEKTQMLSYNDGEYNEFIIFSLFNTEIGNYGLTTSVLHDDDDYSDRFCGFAACDQGYVSETYVLPEDDITGISCKLYNGDILLTDAVDSVLAWYDEHYNFVSSEELAYAVRRIEVRKIGGSDYNYLEFRVASSYDGISINKDICNIPMDGSEDNNKQPCIIGGTQRISMYAKNSIDYVWAIANNFRNANVTESYTEFISLNDACRLLSQYVAKQKKFEIYSIELEYQMIQHYDKDPDR